MKSWLLNAESDVVLSQNEGTSSVYGLRLTFTDLLGRSRSHFASATLPADFIFDHRISFTALSSIEIRPAVVEEISDTKLIVSTLNGRLDLVNIHNHEFSKGQSVVVVEHTDISGDKELLDIAIPYPLMMEPDMLRLQSVNADIVDTNGELLFRLSADPLYQGSSIYVRRNE